MAKIQVRKVYERPALVEIGSMAEKTEFFFSPDFFEKLFAIKKHYFYKKHGGRPDWGHHPEPEFS